MHFHGFSLHQVTEPEDLRGFDASQMMPPESLGGHITFVARAASRVGKMYGDSQRVAMADPYGPVDNSANQGIVAQKPAEYHLDVRSKLAECTLASLPHRCLPDTEAAGFIAAKRKVFKERYCVNTPYVNVEMHKFLPTYCKNAGEMEAVEGGMHRLTILQWVAAVDRYAIAATVAGELSFASASAHKDVVLEACLLNGPSGHVFRICLLQVCATAKKRKPFLGLIYDRLARKQWEQRASHNEDGFDVNVECRKLDTDILLEAQDEHDRQVSDGHGGKNRDKEWSHNKDWSSNKDWHGGKNSGSKGGGKNSKDKRKGSGQWESADKRGRW